MKESASQQPKDSVSHTLRRLTQLTKYNHDALFSLPWDPSPGCLSFRAGMGLNGLSGVCRLVHCCFSLFFGCMFKVCSLRTTKPSFPCEPHNNFWKDVPGGGPGLHSGCREKKPHETDAQTAQAPGFGSGLFHPFFPQTRIFIDGLSRVQPLSLGPWYYCTPTSLQEETDERPFSVLCSSDCL